MPAKLSINSNILAIFALILLMGQSAHSDEVSQGKSVYNGAGACASCHGPEGKGDGAAATALPVKPANFQEGVFKFDTDGDGTTGTDKDLVNIITNGAAQYGGSPMMVGRADLSEADRKALAAFVLSLNKGN